MLRRWRYILFEYRRLPLARFAASLAHQFIRSLTVRRRRTLGRAAWRPTTPGEIACAMGAADPAECVRRLRDRDDRPFFVTAERASELAGGFRRKFPAVAQAIVDEADRALAHEFDLLGSGPTNVGDPIAWQTDFKTGYAFPRVHHSRVPIHGLPAGADIKVPWELSRCQHLVGLGQAYWLTGNEAYAREIVGQITHWIADNPLGVGCNWACSMDVALRAANWCWAYAFVRYSPAADDGFALTLFAALADHGRFVFANLEKTPAFAGNHYASDLLGLAYLGLLFPELPGAGEWKRFALAELEVEIRHQILPDGVNFEASVSYHRLATELFLFPWLLARAAGESLSDEYTASLERAIEYAVHYTTTGGEAPNVGDNDDGRVHTLAPLSMRDHRYLAEVGAALFDRRDWRQADEGARAYAYWALAGLPANGVELPDEAPDEAVRPASRAFPDARVYALRRGDVSMLVDCGGVGQDGRGGHAHHDALSFVLAVGETWVVCDPGTGVYTADPSCRNRLRRTASHNTIVIDDAEQGALSEGELFLLGGEAEPVVEAWESTERFDRLAAFHDGYRRDGGPGVRHRREVLFDKEAGFYRLTDRLEGSGRHTFRQRLHLGAVEPVLLRGAEIMEQLLLGPQAGDDDPPLRPDLCRLIEYPDFRISILYYGPDGAKARTEPYEYSDTYGTFAEGTVLEYAGAFTDRVGARILIAIEL